MSNGSRFIPPEDSAAWVDFKEFIESVVERRDGVIFDVDFPSESDGFPGGLEINWVVTLSRGEGSRARLLGVESLITISHPFLSEEIYIRRSALPIQDGLPWSDVYPLVKKAAEDCFAGFAEGVTSLHQDLSLLSILL